MAVLKQRIILLVYRKTNRWLRGVQQKPATLIIWTGAQVVLFCCRRTHGKWLEMQDLGPATKNDYWWIWVYLRTGEDQAETEGRSIKWC